LFDGPQVRFELCEYGDISGSIQVLKGLRQGRLQQLVVICVRDECCCNLDTPFRRFAQYVEKPMDNWRCVETISTENPP
jgi:hypothetical protein